ncbi:Carboxylesterase, partial [Scytalidium lignicola]
MLSKSLLKVLCATLIPLTTALHIPQPLQSRAGKSPVVDLGYGIYRGYYNDTSNLNIFKGIRYAAPPTGTLRWQQPQPPPVNRTLTVLTSELPPKCTQGNDAPMPANYNFERSGLGNEDCLFLNVFAPNGAQNLPVLVWIHGGGYGTGQANGDLSEMQNTNNNGFITVVIQYRLGAFGFLSSAEVSHFGTANAGLYDMHFSLQWIQNHIRKLGGDPSRVTISGESSGGGGVMQLALAYGGTEGTKYFRNAIVASPFLPTQWGYDDLIPSQSYYLFAQAVGCLDQARDTVSTTIFKCLIEADTIALQNASVYLSAGGKYGQWAFLPVIDGEFIRQRPSEQLLAGKVNGQRILSGNNADEGPVFVPQTITTTDDFTSFITSLFPIMSNKTLTSLSSVYNIPPTTPGPLFSTTGTSGPTALNQSNFGIGQQQRANNLYAETTFVCPSYWLATAYSGWGKQAWKYQFSVPPCEHGADLDAYYAYNREALGEGTLSDAFRKAVQLMWGRLLTKGTKDQISAAETGVWPPWVDGNGDGFGRYRMLNLNMTGGSPESVVFTAASGQTINLTQNIGAGLEARFEVVDAWTWEGGRGGRCEWWANNGAVVPE